MHIHHLQQWQHTHRFHTDDMHGERSTWRVIGFTGVMMVIEIVAGVVFGSMALLADGWHMGTHAAALGITAFAYAYARRHADDARYSFGTGKVGDLGGFASAIVLLVIAVFMAIESVERLFTPVTIRFDEAIVVAVIGLIVNLVSAWMLQDHQSHSHDHPDDTHRDDAHHHDAHHHDAHHHDHNLRAAYLHVLADALTSLLAIVALFAGKMLGWIWMDALMGIIGAGVISVWSYNLIRATSQVLLDSGVSPHIQEDIRAVIEADADNRVTDLHVWRVGIEHWAAVIAIVTHYPKPIDHYKGLLEGFQELAHVTIEVNQCESDPCIRVAES